PHGALRAHRGRGVPPPAPCRDGQSQADGGDREGVARVGVSRARRAHGIGRGLTTGRANSRKFRAPRSVQALHLGPLEWTTASLVRAAATLRRPKGSPQTTRRHEEGAPANTKGDIMSAWSRREFLRGSLVAGTGLAAGIGFPKILTAQGREPIKVGILHSLSGTMAISEAPIKEVVLMAIGEINKAGGVMGRKVEPVVEDPASNWDLFAEKAKKLLQQDKVATVFGCWTSVSRKSVLPVFEQNNSLLFYPVQYEGEECSKNVIYTGATINQQASPAVDFLMGSEGGNKKRFYLIGTDYVYPRTTNKILRLYLKKMGVKESDIQEEYTPFHHQDYQTIVGKIKSFCAGGDAAVINTINGDSNVPFFKELANQGVTADNCPSISFSFAEVELQALDVKPLAGHLASWN